MASSSDAVERQSSADRRAVLSEVTSGIPSPEGLRRNVFVGIDGVDSSGKTVFEATTRLADGGRRAATAEARTGDTRARSS
ncbi:hypothetical protein BK819_01510 [Microbacterium sp. LCT-H2]|nr:hypothetical protein BK819_01510 [Microbacterium sp. LCT-H2]